MSCECRNCKLDREIAEKGWTHVIAPPCEYKKVPEPKKVNEIGQIISISVDEYHTAATALGNTIKKLCAEIDHAYSPECSAYMNKCLDDADKLLGRLNKLFL